MLFFAVLKTRTPPTDFEYTARNSAKKF